MIKLPTFVDLHTHTRYPDNSNFPSQDIERAALNGGYSEILAMANSEIPIDSVENLKLAREIDQNLNKKKSIISLNLYGILNKFIYIAY